VIPTVPTDQAAFSPTGTPALFRPVEPESHRSSRKLHDHFGAAGGATGRVAAGDVCELAAMRVQARYIGLRANRYE
jgi:hypothetical protein